MSENSSCFNGILRRLLCTGSVPTHPSDYISESNPTRLANPSKIPNHEPKFQPLSSPSASASPGIVARLMGLDSLPETSWKGRAPDLVTRSKSVSFADYLLDFDLTPTQQHRRVRTSVSFREVPAVLNQQQGHEFLVVYLDKAEEFGSKVKKTEELKQGKEQRSKNRESSELNKKNKEEKVEKKKSRKISKLKDEPRRKCSTQSSKIRRNGKGDEGLGYSVRPYKKVVNENGAANLKEGGGDHSTLKKTTTQKNKKKVVVEPKCKKGNHHNAAKKREAVDSSSRSENSSPVSVFNIDDILIQHETWLSEYSSPMNLKSQMKSTPKVSYNEDPEVRAVRRKDLEPINNEDSGDYTELLASKIFRLTEEELKESNWVSKTVEYERFEEICVEFEGLILDVLLNQAIDDFVKLSYEALCAQKP